MLFFIPSKIRAVADTTLMRNNNTLPGMCLQNCVMAILSKNQSDGIGK